MQIALVTKILEIYRIQPIDNSLAVVAEAASNVQNSANKI